MKARPRYAEIGRRNPECTCGHSLEFHESMAGIEECLISYSGMEAICSCQMFKDKMLAMRDAQRKRQEESFRRYQVEVREAGRRIARELIRRARGKEAVR